MVRLLVVSTFLLALLAPAAGAATVAVDEGGVVHFDAGPGEENHLLVTVAEDGRSVTLRDTGVPVVPGTGCTAIAEDQATCTPGEAVPMVVAALLTEGDDETVIDDRAAFGSARFFVDAGAGDDVVVGGEAPDLLTGGPGIDVLRGLGDDDILFDGGPADEHDTYDGGPGLDVLSYVGRAEGVRVHLDDGSDGLAGSAGENDEVTGTETPAGGDGDDDLSGHATPVMEGGDGRDTLRHTATDEEPGTGRLSGGDGEDELIAGPTGQELAGGSGQDRFVCAGGVDTVIDPHAGEVLRRACDQVRRTFGDRGRDSITIPAFPVRVTRYSVRFRLNTPKLLARDSEPVSFKGKLTLRAGAELLGLTVLRTPPVETFVIHVPLNADGRRLTRRPKGVRTTLRLRGSVFPPLIWTIRLRRPDER